jgi:methylmalonyl-CoA/ethylmalonyl-CoA epimerase
MSSTRVAGIAALIDSAPMFTAIDHVGVAVSDLDRALELYEGTFGMPLVHRETLESQGVEAVLLDGGNGHVELLRPLGPETAVGRFIESRGEGIHHVAYRVDDIDAALAALSDEGIELIDEQARIGIRSSRVAFVHPHAVRGVLTELVEPATEPDEV